ncbi:MAG: YczE/YyaS/YitT family protein [Acidimicrobiia bacterium]
MLPMPSRSELARRLPRLVLGLVLFGFGVALLVEAGLGLAPWEVLHQGISIHTGIPIGTVGILTGILVLLLWIPLGERVGIGTILNVFLIGIVIDLTLWLSPLEDLDTWQQWTLLGAGTLIVAVGSGYYIGAGLGPGPRDGLMTGLARKGLPVGLARAMIEITVLVLGWFLGGTVGVGTVVFAFGVGPLVGVILPRLSLPPVTPSRATSDQ